MFPEVQGGASSSENKEQKPNRGLPAVGLAGTSVSQSGEGLLRGRRASVENDGGDGGFPASSLLDSE